MFACFIVLLVQVKPQWSSVFLGYIPSEKLFDTHTDVLYIGIFQKPWLSVWALTLCIAVGILGATVMPHALFLGSFLATQDRTASTVDVSLPHPIQTDEKAASYTPRARLRTWFKSLFDVSRAERIAASREYRTKYGRENNELSFIRGHLTHGIVDIVTSLIGVAVPINSAYVFHIINKVMVIAFSTKRPVFSYLPLPCSLNRTAKARCPLACLTHTS